MVKDFEIIGEISNVETIAVVALCSREYTGLRDFERFLIFAQSITDF